MDKSYISMQNIIKIFPPSNVAIDNLSIEIIKGEIHSIIGENGAGKSTLMKVLFGLVKADEGEIFINGEKTVISSPQEAVKKGIGMVHQEFMLIPEYSVLENIVLGNEETHHGLLSYTSSRKKLETIMQNFKFTISLDEKVKNISIASQQKVEIMKLLYRDVDVLILDEPTAVLAPQEVVELFNLLRALNKEGKTIVFISHKLDEVLDISDSITVMRNGCYVWTKKNENLTKADLADAMVGRKVLFNVEKSEQKLLPVELSVKNLTCSDNGRKTLDDVSFAIHQGEILGVAGIEGNGQFELVNAIMGLIPSTGAVEVAGKDINGQTIRERREKIAYISQDRKSIGSAQSETIKNNLIMSHHYLNKGILGKLNFFSRSAISDFSSSCISDYQIKCQGAESPIGSLSGGNQQKVIIAREFNLNTPVLVIDQPVRGLDIGSIEYIHKRILEKRDEKVAILLVSADLEELFSLSDRIMVMRNGKAVFCSRTEDTTVNEIGEYMLGVR